MNKQLQVMLMELKHDRKKVVIMCTLIAVGVLLWARLIILQDVPKTGFAEPGQPATEGAPESQAGDATKPASENEPLRELPKVYLDTEAALQRDFFQPRESAAAQPEEVDQVPSLDPKSQSEPSEDDAENEAQERRLAFDEAAKRLTLESVILGQTPVAVINGKVLRAGQTIDGFVLERVSARRVVLRRDEFRVVLEMEKPQSGG